MMSDDGESSRIRERRTWRSRLVAFLTGGERWSKYHLSVFLLTFFSYALLHASRKTLSTVKQSLIDVWTKPSNGSESWADARLAPLFPDADSAESFLAFLDFAFLAAYALGLYVSGSLGDRYRPSVVLSLGMCGSAVTVLLFGSLTEWLHFYSKIFYAGVWIVGGLFQSVAWPTEICIMGNWFGHNSRGAVFGLWSACASVGNILGTLIASETISYGYQYAFAINALLLFVGGIVVRLALCSAPRDVGLPDPLESHDDLERVIEEVSERPKAIKFWRAWLLPGVISYSLAYACLKLVNYSYFFWLPFYLHNRFGWSETLADALSTCYDWGGIFAAIVAGIISDHLASRTPVIVTMLVLSMGALFAYANSPNNILINSILMVLTGFFIGGPANLISSAVSADLGRSIEVRGSAEALSTVTGIIDGTGSVGASLGQLLLPVIQQHFGWVAVFYSFIFMMFCTCACLVPLLCKELAQRRRHQYQLLMHSGDDDDMGDGLLADTISVRVGVGAERSSVPHGGSPLPLSPDRRQTTRRHRLIASEED